MTKQDKPGRLALRVSLFYCLAGVVWIFCSDWILSVLISDPRKITVLQTYKGWAFIAATTVLLFALVKRYTLRWEREAMERERAESFSDAQNKVLEMIAVGVPLRESLTALVRSFEAQSPNMICSILLLDEDGVHVRHGAAPNLPEAYNRAVDGQPIGEKAGSCGTAAFRRKAVFVEDIATDPLWENYRDLALSHGLRACWSTPIFDVQRRVLGTFAIYYRRPGRPGVEHMRLIDIATHIAAIAISRGQGEAALRESESRHRRLVESNIIGVMIADIHGRIKEANDALLKMLGYTRADLAAGLRWDTITPMEWRSVDEHILAELRHSGMCPPVEKEYFHQDGHRVPIMAAIAMLEGAPDDCICLVEDLSERKQAEAALHESAKRLELAVESSNTGLWDWNLVTNEIYFSPIWKRQIGYEDREIPNQFEEWRSRVHPDDLARAETTIHAFVEKPWPDYEVEFRFRHKDGSYRWILAKGALMHDERGRPIRMLGSHLDITERKRAEAALRVSAVQLRANLENTPNVAVQWYDEAGRVLYWNPASEAIYGWKAEEAIGKTLDVLVYTPEQAVEFLETLREVRKTGKPVGPSESVVRRRDGSTGWVLSTVFSIPMGEGGTGFVCMDVDITERKQAGEEIQHLKEHFESIFNLSPQSIAITRFDDGLIVDVNQMFTLQHGWKREEVVGKSTLQVNLLQNSKERKKYVDQVKEQGLCRDHEMVLFKKDGSPYSASVSSALIDLRGVPHIISISQDITERKRAEEALHEADRRRAVILESISDAFVSLDRNWCYTYVNKKAGEYLGRPPAELIGKHIWTEFPEGVGQPFHRAYEKAMKERVFVELEEHREPHGRWFENRIYPTEDGLAIYFHDITERKRSEQKLMGSREQLRALLARLQRAQEEERIRVAREVHDELGQLLTSLKMDVRWLEKKLSEPGLPPKLNPLLDRAVVASELADATIATVQKIAAKLRPGALDKLGLAAALTQMTRRFEERSGVHCTVTVSDCAAQPPREVASELFYICQEALTNVARHAHASNVEIQLKAEDDTIILELSDDGVGISEEDLNASRALGLLGMKERVSHCDGTIVFERGKTGGTRITVRVPHAATTPREGYHDANLVGG